MVCKQEIINMKSVMLPFSPVCQTDNMFPLSYGTCMWLQSMVYSNIDLTFTGSLIYSLQIHVYHMLMRLPRTFPVFITQRVYQSKIQGIQACSLHCSSKKFYNKWTNSGLWNFQENNCTCICLKILYASKFKLSLFYLLKYKL